MDLIILIALGTLASQQGNSTDKLWEGITMFLNYFATHPNINICYSKSDMILHNSSDGSYLSEQKSSSHFGGTFYLSDPLVNDQELDVLQSFNAPIHVVATILMMIISFVMEIKVAVKFYKCIEGLPFWVALKPQTPVEVDNGTAIGFFLDTIKMKH